MYFKLVLTVDRKPRWPADLMRTIRPDPETRFWNDLRRAPRWSENLEEDREVPPDASAAREKLREQFAARLRGMVVEQLRRDYLQDGDDKPSSRDFDEEAQEVHNAIRSIRFTIKSIRGGSLEVLLFVLGFARLVQAIGITPDEFSKYMDIAAPAAMNSIFGVAEGAIAAETTPVEAAAVAGDGGGTAASRPRIEPSMASLYFMPALFAAVAFGAAMYAFIQISSRLVEAQATYGGYVHDEMQNVSNERREVADKVATLIAQHDSALAAAQKTLFDDQMTLLKSASATTAARDDAVIDLVKAWLIPKTPPGPEPKPPPVRCALDRTQVKNVQAALIEHLFYRGDTDGRWGPQTENGVSRFQSRMNLPVTGIIDPATALRLGIPCKSP